MRFVDIDKLIATCEKNIEYYNKRINEFYAKGQPLTNEEIKKLNVLYDLRMEEEKVIIILEQGYRFYGNTDVVKK